MTLHRKLEIAERHIADLEEQLYGIRRALGLRPDADVAAVIEERRELQGRVELVRGEALRWKRKAERLEVENQRLRLLGLGKAGPIV